jgi:hypothetical protein
MGMTRLWGEGVAIVVTQDAHGWPVRFVWQNQAHAVQRVLQHWQVDTDWWSEQGRVFRDYVSLTTTDGLLCVVFCDLLSQGWYLAKVYD